MKTFTAILVTLGLAVPAFAGSHGVDEATVEKILAKLTEMECQMDPKDIEMEDDGYDLDDVICKGGLQFDIKLDADLNEVSRRAE